MKSKLILPQNISFLKYLLFLLFIQLFIPLFTLYSCEKEEVSEQEKKLVATVSANEAMAGVDTLRFTDQSFGVISRTWTFPGGEPAASEEPEVHVVFGEVGDIVVTLTVVYYDGTEEKKNFPITITPPPFPGDWGNFTMTESIIVDQSGVDMEGFWPDGKISIIKDEANGKFISFWGEKYSYRTEGKQPYPETQISQVTKENRVFGIGIDEQEGFNDGGSWFIGVHPLSDGRLAGFFHAESHWDGGGGKAYKSIGVTYSSDKGWTWTKGEKILNVDYPKPSEPKWSGLGDGCVVYNKERNQFICYYSAYIPGEDFKICMAASDNAYGASGSWEKWDGSDFTVEGYNSITHLGGPDSKIEGLSSRSGSNPSVMWNHYLQKWVMVYAGWNRVIYMSASDDGLAWETPMAITDVNKEKATCASLMGDNGDTEGGKVVKLYYGRNHNDQGVREMVYRIITYK